MASNSKPAKSKRTTLPRFSSYVKQFEKDWQRLERSGRYDMNKIKDVMMLLIENNGPLPAEYGNHWVKPHGPWDCHIFGDCVLLYEIDEFTVSFLRVGSHNDVFNE